MKVPFIIQPNFDISFHLDIDRDYYNFTIEDGKTKMAIVDCPREQFDAWIFDNANLPEAAFEEAVYDMHPEYKTHKVQRDAETLEEMQILTSDDVYRFVKSAIEFEEYDLADFHELTWHQKLDYIRMCHLHMVWKGSANVKSWIKAVCFAPLTLPQNDKDFIEETPQTREAHKTFMAMYRKNYKDL